jgi:hypothetical protein
MNFHRFILQPYKGTATRFRCPSCQVSRKTFTRYIDTETSDYLHTDVGRCSRDNNCGYHYPPKKYFQENNISFDTLATFSERIRPEPIQLKTTSFIPADLFKATLKGHSANTFVQFLTSRFGTDAAGQMIRRYFIGTSKHWEGAGATIFWQIDSKGKIRTGKIMLYNPATGKRIKEPKVYFSYVHSVLKLPEFNLQQCFFGEHLLAEKSKVVAIVESEKSAIIASLYFPQFIWLAAGGKDGLSVKKFSVLKGRTVILFPDVSKPKEGVLTEFEKWNRKAKEFEAIASIQVSDLLERKASDVERSEGLDLADYLLKFNPQEFTSLGTLNAKPAPKQEAAPELLPPKQVMPLPTSEDIAFSKMVAKQPILERFAAALDLVSLKTGKPFQIVPIEEAPEQPEPPAEPVQASVVEEPTEEVISKLDAIAGRVLKPQQGYRAEEVQQLMQATLKLSSERAKAGVQKMIAFGTIESTWNNLYFLRDSTPF